MSLSDIIATIGVSLLLIAFVLNSRKWVSTESVSYLLLNITGAGLCGYSAYMISFYPFVVLEAVWAAIALMSFLKIVSRGTSRAI
jgi:hypothetical protein